MESMENPNPEFSHRDSDPDLETSSSELEYERNTRRCSGISGGSLDEEMEEAFQTMEDSNLGRESPQSDANLNGRDTWLFDAQNPVRLKKEMVEGSNAPAMGRNPSNDLSEVIIKSRRADRPGPDNDVTIIPVPEVDAVFTGPGWQSMEDKERTTTVLNQFQFLEQHYRTMFLRGEIETRVRKFRADSKAKHYLLRRGFCLNEGFSVAGSIPGVEVGQSFRYREELLLLGVHRAFHAGIDYIKAFMSGYKDASGKQVAVAVSIVPSGGYRDNEDDGGTGLIYTGQGGQSNNTITDGNRALVNSCKLRVPVRVTRRVATSEPGKTLYVYDGLYDVIGYMEDTGSSGYKVWKFNLAKQAGQTSSTVSTLMSTPNAPET